LGDRPPRDKSADRSAHSKEAVDAYLEEID
jgi:hypothetical protein